MNTLGSSGDFGGTDPASCPLPSGRAFCWCKGVGFVPAHGGAGSGCLTAGNESHILLLACVLLLGKPMRLLGPSTSAGA